MIMSAYDRGSTCQCQHMSNFMPAARAHFILPFLEYTPEYTHTHLTPEHPHPQGSHTQHPHGLPTPTLFPSIQSISLSQTLFGEEDSRPSRRRAFLWFPKPFGLSDLSNPSPLTSSCMISHVHASYNSTICWQLGSSGVQDLM